MEKHLGLYNMVEVGSEGSRKAQDVAVLSLCFTEHLSRLVIILTISCKFVTTSYYIILMDYFLVSTIVMSSTSLGYS